MAASLNRATLIGRVGKEPEIRSQQNGNRIASFSVATSETWKDKAGEKQERTQWHNVVVFNDGLVGVVERFVKKGDPVFVEGQIETRKWSDQSGQDRYTTEIVLRQFGGQLVLLGGKREEAPAQRGGGRTGGAHPASDDDLDSIPFAPEWR